MSYAQLILEENVQSNYLAVLRPKRRPGTFTVVSGSIYKTSFDYGPAIACAHEDNALALATSPTLSAGQFFWDKDSNELYVRLIGGGNPNTEFLVATYELYFGEYDAHWHRDPLNTSSEPAYYEPIIKKSPVIRQTQSDGLFGSMPTQSSSITLSNDEHILEKHLYDSSFSFSQVILYHWLGSKLLVENIAKVYDGIMSNVSYDSNQVTIRTLSFVGELDSEFRNPTGENFFSAAVFGNLSADRIAKPIRQIYGMVDGIVPTNISYKVDSPTTSDNRNHVVCAGQTGLAEKVYTVVGASSTTTRTYLNNTKGLNPRDTATFGSTPYYREITTVNRTSNYIEHAALPAALTAGASVKRGFVSRVDLFKDGVKYLCFYGRDYTCTSFAGGTSGFTLTTTAESNTGFPTTLDGNEKISCRAYGRVNDITLNATPFGTDDSQTGNIANQAQIIVDIFKRCVGIPESRISVADFTSALSDAPDPVGFSIPSTAQDGFPSYKTILSNIARTGLFRYSVNDENKWTLSVLKPQGSEDNSLAPDEINNGSFGHDFDYNDILSDVIVQYAFAEIHEDAKITTSQRKQSASTSKTALYLHGVSKSKTFDSLHIFQVDASKLASRLGFIFGDRSGQIKFTTKNRFYGTKIGAIIRVDREAQTGFNFDGKTLNSRKATVVSTDKSRGGVTLTLSDNKGIEDNSSLW